MQLSEVINQGTDHWSVRITFKYFFSPKPLLYYFICMLWRSILVSKLLVSFTGHTSCTRKFSFHFSVSSKVLSGFTQVVIFYFLTCSLRLMDPLKSRDSRTTNLQQCIFHLVDWQTLL